jgi:hypothetical protein
VARASAGARELISQAISAAACRMPAASSTWPMAVIGAVGGR